MPFGPVLSAHDAEDIGLPLVPRGSALHRAFDIARNFSPNTTTRYRINEKTPAKRHEYGAVLGVFVTLSGVPELV
jgi:hypothetical protein